MRARMGNRESYWTSELDGHINTFEEGDIVVSTIVSGGDFVGVVRSVDHKTNKVTVSWGGGSICQHDPEEIQLSLHQTQTVKSRYASRRGSSLKEIRAGVGSKFVGNPDTHGINKPRGGGFSIVQDLVDDLREEPASDDAKFANLRSRRAMYWCGPERTYRMTKREINSGNAECPKCCSDMDEHYFTRNAKLLICDGCGFKISSDKVLRDRPDYGERDNDEEIIVARLRRGNMALHMQMQKHTDITNSTK